MILYMKHSWRKERKKKKKLLFLFFDFSCILWICILQISENIYILYIYIIYIYILYIDFIYIIYISFGKISWGKNRSLGTVHYYSNRISLISIRVFCNCLSLRAIVTCSYWSCSKSDVLHWKKSSSYSQRFHEDDTSSFNSGELGRWVLHLIIWEVVLGRRYYS